MGSHVDLKSEFFLDKERKQSETGKRAIVEKSELLGVTDFVDLKICPHLKFL